MSLLQSIKNKPGVHPASYSMHSRAFPWGQSGCGTKSIIYLHLMHRVRTSGAISLLSPYAFTVCIGTTLPFLMVWIKPKLVETAENSTDSLNVAGSDPGTVQGNPRLFTISSTPPSKSQHNSKQTTTISHSLSISMFIFQLILYDHCS